MTTFLTLNNKYLKHVFLIVVSFHIGIMYYLHSMAVLVQDLNKINNHASQNVIIIYYTNVEYHGPINH